jgi:hypothetical protein
MNVAGSSIPKKESPIICYGIVTSKCAAWYTGRWIMFEVKNRSVESWGVLANVDQKVFDKLLNKQNARDEVKSFVKKQKKLKTYKVSFIKEWRSDQYEIMAENEYDASSKARQFFKDNVATIGFKETPRGKWPGDYAGYDRILCKLF